MKKNKLYYDGQCPLCTAEMGKLNKLACDRIELVDIHSAPALPANKDDLLKRLHLQTDQGFVTGLDANVLAWQNTPIAWLWRILQWPLIKPIASKAYDYWAEKRFEKRYGSQGKGR